MTFQLVHYKIFLYGSSDIGLVRHNNEDFWSHLCEEQLFVLADGMGGHQAGEIAARTAVESLCTCFRSKWDESTKSFEEAKILICEGIRTVNQLIYKLGSENPGLRGMGTTICVIFLHPSGVIFGHVGDSRIYRLREGKLKQLTQDHSLLRELIDLGRLSEEQANSFLYKNIITKAIGTEPSVEPSIEEDSIQIGDTFLMCTDGLTDLVCFQEIETALKEISSEEVVPYLIEKAKQKGGLDNITVVLVKIQEKDGKTNLP